jgi:hypothetical protein
MRRRAEPIPAIVATMLAHGEDRLLTMNRSDFRRFARRIEIVEP